MANSKGKITDTSSTKSSMLLSKVASLKQSVKHGAKVLGRPFKKLKTFIAMAASSCLTHSHSMVSLPTSEASPSENCPIKIDGSQSDGTSCSNSVELGPKEDLGSYLCDYLFMLTLIGFLEVLKAHWWSPIYTFFKPVIEFQYFKNQPCNFFTYTTPKFKTHVGSVCHFQDSKDKWSNANLKHHSLWCFGADTVNTIITVRNPLNATSQSLPSLPTKANNQSCIHITFTWTWKSSKKLSKLFYRQYLTLGIVCISSNGSPRITGQSILSMNGNYVTCWLLANQALNSPLTKPFHTISMHSPRGAGTISQNCSM